jgi:uncharacterized protein (TIGR03083 family)
MTELSRAGPLDYAEILAAERSELLGFLQGLDGADWAAPTECPAWTVKGIALHLLGDDLSILSRQRDGEPSPVAIEAGSDWEALFVVLDRHNERWVEAAAYFSVPLLLEQLRMTGEQTQRWYSTVDPHRLGEPVPWIGPEPAPYWLLCAREYLERWIHQCQIRRAVGRGEWFEGRWVHPAVAVAVRGFPAGFAALPASTGTTVTISFEDGPAWTLRKEEAGWHLHDGAVVDPTVALHLDTPTAALLFSRALSKEELVEHLRFVGDPGLVQTLAAGLAAFFGR